MHFFRLQTVCQSQSCQATFGFHHQLSITADSAKFEQTVQSTIISANIDRPEGGFDALMQIAVCQVCACVCARRVVDI